MPRFLSIDKIPFGAAVLGLGGILFSGFVTFRPNRIAAGEAIPLWQIHSDLWIATFICWAALILASVFSGSRLHRVTVSGLCSILLVLLVTAAGGHAAATSELAGPIARISLGSAFWASLLTLIIIQADIQRRSTSDRKLLSLIILVTCAIVIWMFFSGRLESLSIMREFGSRKERFFSEILTHLMLAGSSVGLAVLTGVPLGLLAHRKKQLQNPTFFTLNTLQTIPSLALFGILIPVLAAVTLKFPVLAEFGIRGIGAAPAVIALTVYSLLPVARNTYTGFKTVDHATVESGIGMGMTPTQLLLKVEIPIASPVILNGIRVALVQAIGLTAVAALIGAGGLGVFIFQGLGQAAEDLILLGAIPTILVAVAADSLMNGMILVLKPKGLS